MWILLGTTTLLLFVQATSACDKEIVEDVCPQREGTDEDCDRRCREAYPGRIRKTKFYCYFSGTLLSLFGIHSFVCRCRLPPAYCQGGSDPVKLSYSISSLQTHSNLNKLLSQSNYCGAAPYHCSDSFTSNTCGWQRSIDADWFEAKAATEMPFAAGERPDGLYLASVGRRSSPELTLSTCGNLCSKSSVEITARLWRSPRIKAELCFKEGGETVFCAPINSANGAYVNETVPETKDFQVYFKFSNVTEGDVIMLDDLNAGFVSCPEDRRKTPKVLETTTRTIERQSVDLNEVDTIPKTSAFPRAFSANNQRVSAAFPLKRRGDIETLRRRYCRFGDCTTLIHQSTHSISGQVPSPDDDQQQCTGREGLLRCKSKCKQLGEDGMSARCLRQKEFPFIKRCVCQAKRAPMRRIEGGSIPKITKGTKTLEEKEIHRTEYSGEVVKNEVWKDSPLRVMDLHCGRTGDDAQCDRHCKKVNIQSIGRCINETDSLRCDCSNCVNLMCDFDGEKECGWTDLRLLSQQFNNISIAAKKDRINRYGLSQMEPLSYSGLLRRGWIDGPVNLSVDIYPSEEVDVRICVDSLYKCQSQKVAAKTWNRVAAKIKVSRTDKIFLLIYNNAKFGKKTIALDNISLSGGNCPARRR